MLARGPTAIIGLNELAQPLKMKAISEAKIKTDKTNAETLAHFLRANLIPESYMVSKASREVKNVLRDSMFWVRVKTMVKSRIRTLVVRHPETTRDL